MLLRDYLERILPGVDRVFLRGLAAQGRVTVNGEDCEAHRRLRRNDLVLVELPAAQESLPKAPGGSDAPVSAHLFKDEEIVVLDKPSGVPAAIPGEIGAAGGSLLYRLEREASGCLVGVLDPSTRRRRQREFAEGQVGLEYVALVVGSIRWREREVAEALGPDPRHRGRVEVCPAARKGSRPAATRFEHIEGFRRQSLVRALPRTWRNHSVRAHLRFLGHPVVADPDYGSTRQLLLSEIKPGYKSRIGVAERPLLERMFLHVAGVEFRDHRARPVEVVAPLPGDLESALRKLRRFAPPNPARRD
jgi:23S rRNA-/tRNA-specific pseudouridylate synthase